MTSATMISFFHYSSIEYSLVITKTTSVTIDRQSLIWLVSRLCDIVSAEVQGRLTRQTVSLLWNGGRDSYLVLLSFHDASTASCCKKALYASLSIAAEHLGRESG